MNIKRDLLCIALLVAVLVGLGLPAVTAFNFDMSQVGTKDQRSVDKALPGWLAKELNVHESSTTRERYNPLSRAYITTAEVQYQGDRITIYYESVEFGWPWSAWSYDLIGAEHIRDTAYHNELLNELSLKRGFSPGMRLQKSPGITLLPTKVRIGILYNIVLAMILMSGVYMIGVFALRKRRMARNICIYCKYPIAYDVIVCPECGKSLHPRRTVSL